MKELMYNAKMADSYKKIDKFLFELGFNLKEISCDENRYRSIRIPPEEHGNLLSFFNHDLSLNIYFFKCKNVFKIYLADIFFQMNQIHSDKITFVNSDTFINFLNGHILNSINTRIDNLYTLKLKCQAL
jgi:hypothetical protein